MVRHANSETCIQNPLNVNFTLHALTKRVNTKDLGIERTLELLGSYFYRPKITDDIKRFAKTIRPLLEEKKPSQIHTAAMQGFTTPGTSEFFSMNL